MVLQGRTLSRGPAEIPTRESLQQSHGLLFPCTIYKISVLIIEIQIAVNLESWVTTFSSRLKATLNLCLIYLKLLEHVL